MTGSPARAADTARLFFAAWPAPEVQRALGGIARGALRECGGRAIADANIHLTLVFLGDVPRGAVAVLEASAAMIDAQRFELSVDRLDYWRHNRIVWAGVEECPAALTELVAGLQHSLVTAQFRFDRRPYVPHITLLRDARGAPADRGLPAVRWPVAEFALVESAPQERGRTYVVLRSWPLRA